jgi:hypothetical protein
LKNLHEVAELELVPVGNTAVAIVGDYVVFENAVAEVIALLVDFG